MYRPVLSAHMTVMYMYIPHIRFAPGAGESPKLTFKTTSRRPVTELVILVFTNSTVEICWLLFLQVCIVYIFKHYLSRTFVATVGCVLVSTSVCAYGMTEHPIK